MLLLTLVILCGLEPYEGVEIASPSMPEPAAALAYMTHPFFCVSGDSVSLCHGLNRVITKLGRMQTCRQPIAESLDIFHQNTGEFVSVLKSGASSSLRVIR